MIEVSSIERGKYALWTINHDKKVVKGIEAEEYKAFLADPKRDVKFEDIPFDEIEFIVTTAANGKPVQHRSFEQVKNPVHYFKCK